MKWIFLKAVQDEILRRLSPSNRLLLFLEYDSLAPANAEGAGVAPLDPTTREQLRELSEFNSLTLTVVGDYAMAALKKMVGFSGIYLIANHGLEIFGPDLNVVHGEAKRIRQVVKDLHQALAAKRADMPGVELENRDLSLTVNFRQAKPAVQRKTRIILEQMWTPLMDSLYLHEKNSTLVLRPRLGWGKGRAVMFLWNKFAAPRRRPLVMTVGADESVEEIFGFMGREGMGVVVGNETRQVHSKAGYFLKNRHEVTKLIAWLIQSLPHPNHTGTR